MSKKRVFASQAEVAALMNLYTATPINERIPKAQILERTGMIDRHLRDAASRLVVEHGVPLIAYRGKGGGYKLSNNVQEIGREVLRLNSHAREMYIRRDCLTEILVRFGGDPRQWNDAADGSPMQPRELKELEELLDHHDEE